MPDESGISVPVRHLQSRDDLLDTSEPFGEGVDLGPESIVTPESRRDRLSVIRTLLMQLAQPAEVLLFAERLSITQPVEERARIRIEARFEGGELCRNC